MSNSNSNSTEALDELAKNLAEQSAKIPIAAQRIINRSFPQILENSPGGFVPAYLQMGTANVHWQLFLEKQKGEMVFFFSKRKRNGKENGELDNSFTTDISFSLSPAANSPPIPETSMLGHFWAPPPFLELAPPGDLVGIVRSKIKKDTSSNLLWLRLGPDLMAIHFVTSEQFQNSDLFYFENRKKPVEHHPAKKAPLAWFKAMLAAIRPWASGETATPIPINMDRSGEIREILSILSNNFLSISKGLQGAYKDEAHPLQPFYPFYELSNYAVKVRLRLTSEGKVVEEAGLENETEKVKKIKEDLFQLEVLLKGEWEEGRPVIHFKILPPDFLVSGPLFNAFVQELIRPKGEKKPEQHLTELAKVLKTTAAALEHALTHNAPGAFIFRIQRKKTGDTQMFVLPVTENGQARHLFFSADFKVDAGKAAVTLKKIPAVKNLLKKNGEGDEMEHPGEKYFMRLMFHIKEWKNRVKGS